MNWLFWKEYRQNRVVVFALIMMLVVPYLFGLYAMGYQWHIAHIRGQSWQLLIEGWREILAVASIYSFGISQVALALIGGNVIDSERADRSADFQAYLPLTQKILAGKLLLVLAIAATIWLINPLIAWIGPPSVSDGSLPPPYPNEHRDNRPGVLLRGLVLLHFPPQPHLFHSCRLADAPDYLEPYLVRLKYLIHGETWYGGKESILHTWYVCL